MLQKSSGKPRVVTIYGIVQYRRAALLQVYLTWMGHPWGKAVALSIYDFYQ